ncbi:MAG TPA: hypothetical protein VN598_01845 [Usitatibacter sp.]|nr:hypothetical protein [Usitatibacter sp.]
MRFELRLFLGAVLLLLLIAASCRSQCIASPTGPWIAPAAAGER